MAMPFYDCGNYISNRVTYTKSKFILLLILLVFAFVQYGCISLNGRVDMNFISLGNPLLFYAGALSGVGVIWCITNIMPEINILKRISSASMLIFVTHWLLYSVLTVLIMIFLNVENSFVTTAIGSVVYTGWAVTFGVLTFGYWKKYANWMLGNR
jgi:hypothetical protein